MMTGTGIRNAVLEVLKDTPIGRKLEEQRRTEQHATRAVQVKALAEAKDRRERELPPLQADAELAKANVLQARLTLQQAESIWRQKQVAVASLDSEIVRTLESLQATLRASADPQIAQFMEEMWTLFHHNRHIPSQSRTEFGELNVATLKRNKTIVTNTSSIEARLNAIRAAIRSAEALQVADIEDVAGALNKLRASIPPIVPP